MANKDFSQYLAEARAKYGTAKPVAAKPLDLGAFKKKPAEKSQDFLSWAVDILSRPMRAIENIPNQVFNEVLKMEQAKKTGQDYNIAGGIGNIVTAGPRGFWSNSPEDQPTGAELIEKGTDAFGQLNDPRYKDVQDNVNPWVKGIGGFGLDVGLDPLTYIPGAQIVKGAQLVGRGIKGAAAGADALIAGSNVGEALGASSRIAKRAAKVADTKAAENAAFLTQRELQPFRLQDTAFGAKMAPAVPEARIAAADIVGNLNRVEAPTIPTPNLVAGVFSKAIGPATKAEVKASKRLTDALRATDEIAPTPSPAAMASGIDEAALMDSVGAPIGSTVREQFAATGAVPDILAQLDLIRPGTVKAEPIAAKTVKVPAHPKGWSVDERVMFEVGKDPYSSKITQLKNKINSLESVKYGMASKSADTRRVNNLKKLKAELANLGNQKSQFLKDQRAQFEAEAIVKPTIVAEEKAARSFSASTALKQVLSDPAQAQAMKDILGEGVVAKLAGIKSPQTLMRATEHLGKVIRGEATSGSKIQNELAQEIRLKYDVKIPGTDMPAIVGTSAVNTPVTAEAQVAKAVGQDLQDVPWIGGYTAEQIDEVIRDMPEYLKNDFLDLTGYSYITGRGALSTSDTAGEGLHKFANEFNQMDQAIMMQRLTDTDRARIKAHNIEMKRIDNRAAQIAADNRADQILRAAINKTELALRWMDTKGASAWMGIDRSRIRLYGHQMLRELNLVDKKTLALIYLNEPTSIPMTNIMDAVVGLYRNPKMGDDELLSLLRKPIKGANNFLLSGKTARFGHFPGEKKPSKGLWEVNKDEKGRIRGWYRLWTPDEVQTSTLAMLRKAAPDIEKAVLHNEEMALARTIAEAPDLSAEVVRSIFDDANDPAAFGELVRKIANVPVHTGDRGAANFVKPDVDPIVAKPATDYWPNDVIHDARYIEALVKQAAKDPKVAREAMLKLGIDEAKYAGKSAEEIIALQASRFDGVGANGRVVNEAMFNDAVNELAFNEMLAAGRVAKIRELVQYNAGKGQVIHKFNQANIQLSKGLADFKLNINRVAKLHSGLIPGTETTVLAQALRDLAVPGKASTGAVAAARKDLEPLVWSVFGNPNDGPYAMGIWQRAGGTLDDLQVYMKKAKLPYLVDLTNAETRVARGEYPNIITAGINDWKNWVDEIDDPLKFLADMHWAGSMLHVDKTAAALFVARAGVTSSVPMPGYSRIPDLDLFEHPLMGHMPKNTFIKDDVLQEVNNLEKMIMSDYSPKSPFGKFLNEKYLPVLGAWKKGVTIYRLGHHTRNLLSSEGIQWTVEGNRYYLSSMGAAMKTLMKHKNYDGVDWAQTVTELDTLRMPTGGDNLFSFGNKKVTVDALYEAAEKHGLFTDFRLIEDLFDDGAKSKFTDVINKVSLRDTAVERLAGGLSEYQSHFSRLHHFSQILMKQGKKGRNWEKAVEEAAKKVRRHHPDGMTLTPFERAYLKPLIPFYSWFRQMIPVIAEGIVQNPGRFMVYPKASYNMAVAMGVDPQSLQDPFPANELFPDFITDQLTGPVAQINGNYFTGAPGYAYADILNQFVADPQRGAISMITPFIKTPGELITGTKWDTGTSIKDYSDYIDSQIPGINYLSNFTGTSTTGSVVGLLTGQGIDTQYAVDKGNKTLLDQGLSVSNWFTGLGLQNISKENYRNLAEIQARDEAKRKAEEAAGTARNPF